MSSAVAQYDYKQIISQSAKSHHLAVISNPSSLQYFLPHSASNASTEELKVRETYLSRKCLFELSWQSTEHTHIEHTTPESHRDEGEIMFIMLNC